jgi:catechol 2,3-dioxygenase-like lactoylglutathione lyase family enzyme
MIKYLAHVALIVDDYDRAIEYYVHKLNFKLLEDTVLSDTKRWVLVAPKGASECSVVLAKASGEEQKSRIGNQTGGRVFMFLYTDNLQRDYQTFLDNKIRIVEPPRTESYGSVFVFKDLYGNLWDMIEPANEKKTTNKQQL